MILFCSALVFSYLCTQNKSKMKTNFEIRYAAHPEDAKHYDTARLRRDFLIERVFAEDEVNMVYSMYDRMVVGGAMPVNEALRLEAIDPLKAPFFTTRREVGIYNVGGAGEVIVGDESFHLDLRRHFISEVATARWFSRATMQRSLPSSTSIPRRPIIHIPARR